MHVYEITCATTSAHICRKSKPSSSTTSYIRHNYSVSIYLILDFVRSGQKPFIIHHIQFAANDSESEWVWERERGREGVSDAKVSFSTPIESTFDINMKYFCIVQKGSKTNKIHMHIIRYIY